MTWQFGASEVEDTAETLSYAIDLDGLFNLRQVLPSPALPPGFSPVPGKDAWEGSFDIPARITDIVNRGDEVTVTLNRPYGISGIAPGDYHLRTPDYAARTVGIRRSYVSKQLDLYAEPPKSFVQLAEELMADAARGIRADQERMLYGDAAKTHWNNRVLSLRELADVASDMRSLLSVGGRSYGKSNLALSQGAVVKIVDNQPAFYGGRVFGPTDQPGPVSWSDRQTLDAGGVPDGWAVVADEPDPLWVDLPPVL